MEFSCLLSPPAARYPIDVDAEWLVTKAQATNAMLSGRVALPLYTATAAVRDYVHKQTYIYSHWLSP